MIDLITDNRQAIESLCRAYNVSRLEVFGSAAAGVFDDRASDVDFVVEFQAGQKLGPWLSHYLDFKAELETLFARKVDLVMSGAIKDRHFMREANKTRRLLYAA